MQNRRDGRVVRDHTVAASRASCWVSLPVHACAGRDHSAQIRGSLFAGPSGSSGSSGPSGAHWPLLAINPGRGKLLSNSRLPICSLIPSGSKVALIAVRGQWRSVRQENSQTVRLLALLRHTHTQSLPATHPNTALRYCACHIRSPGGMSWKYIVPVPHTPRATHTYHAHALTLTFPHRFRIPSAKQHNGPGRAGVGRHPTTLPPARRAPCPRILSPF